jgi:excinuclease ABC subunit A
MLQPYAGGKGSTDKRRARLHPEQLIVTQRIAEDLVARLDVLLALGLGYLALERSTPTLSPGELQRLRLATQVRSNLFGVVYVLDEPSAGLHPADTEALLTALDQLKASGNSLFVVEHALDVIRCADWIVDVGPAAGEKGGEVLYSGAPDGLKQIEASQTRRYDAGRFSFNVAKGRCANCEGVGFVSVELLFLPSVYAPCPTCQGARYNAKTLEVAYNGKNIAEVLGMTVDAAAEFFAAESAVARSLEVLRDVGLGYLRLGQPATELSGGEAQRIKLATELQRAARGNMLYVLDEPTTGLHSADVEKLLVQLNRLVDAGNTVIAVEHTMRVVAASDWVIDIGPGAGENGGKVVAEGPPREVAAAKGSATAPYLAAFFGAR